MMPDSKWPLASGRGATNCSRLVLFGSFLLSNPQKNAVHRQTCYLCVSSSGQMPLLLYLLSHEHITNLNMTHSHRWCQHFFSAAKKVVLNYFHLFLLYINLSMLVKYTSPKWSKIVCWLSWLFPWTFNWIEFNIGEMVISLSNTQL